MLTDRQVGLQVISFVTCRYGAYLSFFLLFLYLSLSFATSCTSFTPFSVSLPFFFITLLHSIFVHHFHVLYSTSSTSLVTSFSPYSCSPPSPLHPSPPNPLLPLTLSRSLVDSQKFRNCQYSGDLQIDRINSFPAGILRYTCIFCQYFRIWCPAVKSHAVALRACIFQPQLCLRGIFAWMC